MTQAPFLPQDHAGTGSSDRARAERAARYYTALEMFDVDRPPVRAHRFDEEHDRALAPGPSRFVPCDAGAALDLPGPATTPHMLGGYLRVREGDPLAVRFRASTELYCVLAGSGTTRAEGWELPWAEGDVFSLPGGQELVHEADEDSMVWVVSNQPHLELDGLDPPAPAGSRVVPAFFPRHEIDRQLERVYADPRAGEMAGMSVNFGNAALEGHRVASPSFGMSLNTLAPGASQRPHRHNATALTMVVSGGPLCYSEIEHERHPWRLHTALVTPPAHLHSHHNTGPEPARFFIVQDSGVFLHARASGFAWA